MDASDFHNGTNTTIILNGSMYIMIVPYQSSSGSSVTKLMWICSHEVCSIDNG